MESQAAVYTVITTADSGAGSLRQALLNANTSGALPNAGVQGINFQLPGPPYSIAPLSALPKIIVPVVIDGTTQPGYAGQPVIELNGTNTANAIGLEVVAPSTIRGLVLNRWANNAIQLDTGSNVIAGNWIGTDLTGLRVQTNLLFGIYITSSGNQIGGTNAADRNVICGNDTGVYIAATGGANTIAGNWIGVNAASTAALGNVNNGILVYGSAGNVIGGTSAGAGNVISGNHASGIYLYQPGAAGNVIQGNYLGVDATGIMIISNNADGITLNGATGSLIGPGNVISGNGMAGVNLASSATSSNTVTGNLIGTDKTGSIALRNLGPGVAISGGSANQIGGGNVISGNQASGIQLTTGAHGNWIQGNLIGANAGGTAAVPNGLNGVTISGAISNWIGGAAAGTRNIISGNTGNGIYIQLPADTGNQVQGNYVGTDVTGLKAVANGNAGILLQGATNFIGSPGTGNLISGNGQQGVFLAGANGGVAGNVVQGNIIGLAVNGNGTLGNGNAGVGISFAAQNQIGGSATGAGNVISANGDAGIFIIGSTSTRNVIQGNYLGTDATGRLGRGNTYEGIYSQDGGASLIGGTAPGAGNLVSANHTRGIWLTNSSGNVLQGNTLGTDVTGTNALGNTYHTIEIAVQANANIVASNRIAYAENGYAGVRIRDGAQNNLVSGNSIFGNTGLGIDLGNYWVNPNADCELGISPIAANAYQNTPTITNVVCGPGTTLVQGYLDSGVNKAYQIEFFANPVRDPSGAGQGKVFLGAIPLTLGGACTTNFSAILPATVPAGWWVAATATDPANNTSEFSGDVQAFSLPPIQMVFAGPSSLTETNRKGHLVSVTTYTNTILSFTNPGVPYTLWQTHSLAPPVTWVPAPSQPSLAGGIYSLTIPQGAPSVFFRLSTP